MRLTFGDGSISKVIGKGYIKPLGMPKLDNVLYVKGLKSNLISTSQLCDDGNAGFTSQETNAHYYLIKWIVIWKGLG